MEEQKQIKPAITIKNLNVTYFRGRTNEVKALREISLKIYPGEFIIFFGPSGCGKSTLLYSIAGLESHTEGDIVVQENNLTSFSQKKISGYRQKTIGMIFQAFYLIPTLSVFNNVLLPQMAIGADASVRESKARSLLERFDVASQANKLPSELSGGQQQRVAVCRALINDPDIILADEPIGNLDSKSAREVLDLLQDLNTNSKKTIILVTHDPSELHRAHRVFYMKDGKITDVRINRSINEQIATAGPEASKPQISRELELLIRTYSSIAPGQIGTMLIPFKAKQIVMEALMNLSLEDEEKIEEQVRHMLMSSLGTEELELEQFLDADADKGGLGLDARSAKRIAERIAELVAEIKTLRTIETKEAPGEKLADEVLALRHYLTVVFDLTFRSDRASKAFGKALEKRMSNGIDKAQFQAILDADIQKDGAGLDKRTARKVAKRVELIMLGKFNG